MSEELIKKLEGLRQTAQDGGNPAVLLDNCIAIIREHQAEQPQDLFREIVQEALALNVFNGESGSIDWELKVNDLGGRAAAALANTPVRRCGIPDTDTLRQILIKAFTQTRAHLWEAHAVEFADDALKALWPYLQPPEPVSVDLAAGAAAIQITAEIDSSGDPAFPAYIENARQVAQACAKAWGLKWK